MNFVWIVVTNGFVLLVPVLIWNMVVMKYLPGPYRKDSCDKNIPSFISAGEAVGRVLVFALPLFFSISFTGHFRIAGWVLYLSGIVIYFLSWVLEIKYPDSAWSRSLIGFTAPAWTISIWLTGIVLLSDSFYYNLPFSRLVYLVSAIVMTTFHTLHWAIVWRRN